MEAQLSSVHSFPAQDYAESFASDVPQDSRFLQSSYQKVPPETNIDGKTIAFELHRYEAANVYLIQDTCVELFCKITKADGSAPLKTAQVI